jgi:ElaB/YqjD/DUF883 family membrane-anchored ribosome-binding protein
MEHAGTVVDRKANQAHQVVDDVARSAADKAAPAIDRVAQAAHQTVDKVAAAAAPAADWAKQSADQIKQQQDALLDSCRGYVRERPLVVLGTAIVAGYLFGRLTR